MRSLSPIFIAAAGLLIQGCVKSGEDLSTISVVDYLTPNVCVEVDGQPASGDPAFCSNARNLRLDEKLPYQLTDYDKSNGRRYQTVLIELLPGSRILVTKQLEHYSGYDLIEYTGEYVSIIETSDPGCGVQILSGAGMGDGWILMPTALPNAAANHKHAMRLERVSPLPQCHDKSSVSSVPDNTINAVWHPPEPFAFESGKTLLTIRTEHHAHFDLSRTENAKEVIYFTREYGFSRWEAWIPEARCLSERSGVICILDAPDNPLRGRCRSETAIEIHGGQRWVRIDCRDTTFVQSNSQ